MNLFDPLHIFSLTYPIPANTLYAKVLDVNAIITIIAPATGELPRSDPSIKYPSTAQMILKKSLQSRKKSNQTDKPWKDTCSNNT